MSGCHFHAFKDTNACIRTHTHTCCGIQILAHLLNKDLRIKTTPLGPVSTNTEDFYVGRILGSQLVALRRARFSTSNEPSVIIGGRDVLVLAVLHSIQIKGVLVCHRLGMANVGMIPRQGKAEKGQSVYLGLGGV